MDDLIAQLLALGLEEAPTDTAQAQADAAGMSRNGTYTVERVLTSTASQLTVRIEQNQSPDLADDSEVTSLVSHPALAVVSSPKGRAAAKVSDPEAVLAVVDALS